MLIYDDLKLFYGNRGIVMLKRFEVKNYKGFKDCVVWDLSSVRTYSDKKDLIKNALTKNNIVYGKNGSGKTSLCSALMDITYHLLDVQKDNTPSYMYSYIGNNSDVLEFKYVFKFDKKEVVYFYKESNTRDLLFEQLFVDKKEIVRHDFINEEQNFIKIKGLQNLRTNNLQRRLSVLKFIYNNTIIDENSIIFKLFSFVKGMLYFRSLRESNQYIGYKLGADTLDDIILRNQKLEDFQKFLSELELNYTLVPLKLSSGNMVIGAKFENGSTIPLSDISSSGTKVLTLFYCWLLEFKNLTFLIIDEFDAYYHYDVARKILHIINRFDNLQSMVTTHNVTLLNTEVTRPDCAYIIDNHGVINLSDRINKDIRKSHNIEKMYRAGEFDNYIRKRDDQDGAN